MEENQYEYTEKPIQSAFFGIFANGVSISWKHFAKFPSDPHLELKIAFYDLNVRNPAGSFREMYIWNSRKFQLWSISFLTAGKNVN